MLACSSSGASSQQGATLAASPPMAGQAAAVFAGGCFWCMEPAFESLPGVLSVTSGYTGGRVPGPAYDDVSTGRTGHVEAVRVVYDPSRVDYARLLDVFWHNVDPTQDDGQFCDRGEQYRSAVFVASAEERRLAEASKARMEQHLGRRIVTTIRDAATFWIAEAYHQDYYRTHAEHYQRYRRGCGRDARLRAIWGAGAAGH
ncbi:MAG: peptide-methionine (S)-S-oxide reductase MsrA [Sandaracinaceae bacterium]|nr:peptide-methionine (S)-S-oxide reductase MsrA [Sandaracinaceae bacterium]